MAKSWTQEDLAGECGLDRSYVSGLEVGRRNPTYLNLLRIAKTLELPLVTLLDFRNPPKAR
jgi:transcriptional regulator with XRE-family HTH domain